MNKRVFLLAMVVLALFVPAWVGAQDRPALVGQEIIVSSGGLDYKSYLAAPDDGGVYPAIVLIHSYSGLEQGYRTMTEKFAAEGFVVFALGWQSHEKLPGDAVVTQLVEDSVTMLKARPDVDVERIGLTGFCAGGFYTMLLLGTTGLFDAGVAWYGFPNGVSGFFEGVPVEHIDQITAPMLMIHPALDEQSAIADIYAYAQALDAAKKVYELKVYSGEKHGFMLEDGQLRHDEVAISAFNEMVNFFQRKLG